MKNIIYCVILLLSCCLISNNVEAKKKKYPNGDIYEGQWKKGQPEGIGKMMYCNGDTYEGYWSMGKQSGQGKMVYGNKELSFSSYEGLWKEGLQEGIGKMVYRNGNEYEGNWIKGLESGQGRMVYKSNIYHVYDGLWQKGKPEGIGEMVYRNRDVYKGNWNYGLQSGQGKMIYANGNVYEGNWNMGRQSGRGKMTYANGDYCDGLWEQDQFYSGECNLHYENGDYFTGEMKNKQYFKGEGKISLAKDIWQKGCWENGRFIKGEWQKKDNYYNGKWNDTTFIGDCKISINKDDILNFKGYDFGNGEMKGLLSYSEQDRYIGEIREYKRNGKGVFYHRADSLSGQWKDNILLSGGGQINFAEGIISIDKEDNEPIKVIVNISDIKNKQFEINPSSTEVNNIKGVYDEIFQKVDDFRIEEGREFIKKYLQGKSFQSKEFITDPLTVALIGEPMTIYEEITFADDRNVTINEWVERSNRGRLTPIGLEFIAKNNKTESLIVVCKNKEVYVNKGRYTLGEDGNLQLWDRDEKVKVFQKIQ